MHTILSKKVKNYIHNFVFKYQVSVYIVKIYLVSKSIKKNLKYDTVTIEFSVVQTTVNKFLINVLI